MDTQRQTLLAGAATSTITPALGTSLNGPIGQNKPASHVHDDLLVRCLALSDGKITVAFGVCDGTMIAGPILDRAKARITRFTELPSSHVMLTATHTHSAPRSLATGNNTADERYLAFLSERIADGVIRAVNQLAPARIGWARTHKPEHVHNRRWFVGKESLAANPFGHGSERVRMNPPHDSMGLGPAAGPVDDQLTVLGVQHVDGTPLALLANYGLHYIGGVPAGHVSADYYGRFSTDLERRLDPNRHHPPFVAILSNGASGDVNNIDVTKPRERHAPYERMRRVARDMADTVMDLCDGMAFADTVELGVATGTLEIGVRRPSPERKRWAEEMLADVKPGQRLSMPQIYAREALLLAGYPATVPVRLQACRVGPVAMVGIPCEVFAETGLAIKEASPHEATCILSLANGYHGYLPTPEQHELGGYETWPARSSSLDIEAESHIREEAIRLLAKLA